MSLVQIKLTKKLKNSKVNSCQRTYNNWKCNENDEMPQTVNWTLKSLDRDLKIHHMNTTTEVDTGGGHLPATRCLSDIITLTTGEQWTVKVWKSWGPCPYVVSGCWTMILTVPVLVPYAISIQFPLQPANCWSKEKKTTAEKATKKHVEQIPEIISISFYNREKWNES